MKRTKQKARGLEAFNTFFGSVYGERWPTLFVSLQKDPSRCALVNPFAVLGDKERAELESSDERCASPWRSQNGLMSHYALDRASVLAASALPIKPGHRVLDMCAAPGGKALSLIFRAHEDNHFVLNERSATRRARLQKVLDDYVPQDRHAGIKVTGHDATKWCLYEKDAYDAILLDAPCSSERHLLEKPSLMAEWSPHRTYALALQQFAMLASAAAAIKAGGHILYATCSISPSENDDVISKLLKKRDGFDVMALTFDTGEATQHGWIFLPDASSMGPLFLSLIRRQD